LLALGGIVRQVNLGRARFEQDVAIVRSGDFTQALGGQHHRRILLAEGAQPFLQLGAESPVGQGNPCLIDND
jgi:hypothetical protein